MQQANITGYSLDGHEQLRPYLADGPQRVQRLLGALRDFLGDTGQASAFVRECGGRCIFLIEATDRLFSRNVLRALVVVHDGKRSVVLARVIDRRIAAPGPDWTHILRIAGELCDE